MEAGVLIQGVRILRLPDEHLHSLVDRKVIAVV